MKYFCEDAPQYHIIAAGSLLGVSLSQGDSFPVGKVEFQCMYPVTFREFLYSDNPRMYEYLESLSEITSLPEIVMGKLSESWRRYQVCGGMPAAVAALLTNQGTEEVENRQQTTGNTHSLFTRFCQTRSGKRYSPHRSYLEFHTLPVIKGKP